MGLAKPEVPCFAVWRKVYTTASKGFDFVKDCFIALNWQPYSLLHQLSEVPDVTNVVVVFFLVSSYLANWREFCQVVTIAFSLSLVALMMGVVLAMGRGLTSLRAVYIYEEGQSYRRNVHKASVMLQK